MEARLPLLPCSTHYPPWMIISGIVILNKTWLSRPLQNEETLTEQRLVHTRERTKDRYCATPFKKLVSAAIKCPTWLIAVSHSRTWRNPKRWYTLRFGCGGVLLGACRRRSVEIKSCFYTSKLHYPQQEPQYSEDLQTITEMEKRAQS